MILVSYHLSTPLIIFLFFFTDTATTEIYTLSLHDALPICGTAAVTVLLNADVRWSMRITGGVKTGVFDLGAAKVDEVDLDRKSTRLNSSHSQISYAVFCLKKKKKKNNKYMKKLREYKLCLD